VLVLVGAIVLYLVSAAVIAVFLPTR
jgi:hypothetical protein